ncbi:hypothetical protein SCB49_10097 [unidentified eubacterium SCB49]|nr:hypothetical protein SCB49_10097 [unidentified eubacterium SCB49]
MKNITTLGLIFLLSTPLFAQVGTTNMTLTNLQNTQIDLEQKRETYGLNDMQLNELEGSPYTNSNFRVGNLYKNNTIVKKNVLLRYNAFSRQIEIKNNQDSDNDDYGSLIKDSDIQASINGNKFILIPFENSDEKGDYYEILSHGATYDLYKKTNVRFVEPYIAKTSYEKNKPAKFIQSHVYYLSSTSDKKLLELPTSNRKIIKLLGEKDKDIKSFIKSNDIDVSEEGDLIKIVKRYDSLFQ